MTVGLLKLIEIEVKNETPFWLNPVPAHRSHSAKSSGQGTKV
ncbi:MAG: hypothetical protein NWF13_00365 [Candidatus Bathyarchaeota archaeon]|nr:hypothetical protein [Candidatus Bathyarchaeota archaeon]